MHRVVFVVPLFMPLHIDHMLPNSAAGLGFEPR